MLPYTPLHHLLMAAGGAADRVHERQSRGGADGDEHRGGGARDWEILPIFC